ncbi:hypothetical protein T261_1576 [Streptomyces lydicus]|nr:hypothetical protein T261_1576 [Streptomyces lydicus]
MLVSPAHREVDGVDVDSQVIRSLASARGRRPLRDSKTADE